MLPRVNAPLRLLIADDDPVMRMLLGAMVGADPEIELVGEAEDAEQAIALADQHEPDVALLDIEMPKGGGLHAAREIHARHPAIRLFALSAHESGDAREAMAQAGATGYVVKGAAPAEVLAALKA
jgi:DNA-binding NarL/FixJ family response regulator